MQSHHSRGDPRARKAVRWTTVTLLHGSHYCCVHREADAADYY